MAQEKLATEELNGLQELARGGMLTKNLPDHIRRRLIQLEYAEEKLGGLVATSKGKLYAASHKK